MALLLALFFHNSLVQNVIIYLVDIWHYANFSGISNCSQSILDVLLVPIP